MGTKRPWIKIGEGDDMVESWCDPFDEPVGDISSLMLDAESYDLEIDWSVVLRGLQGFGGLARCGWRVDSVEDLFRALEGDDVRIEDKQWEGGGPGLSGVYLEVFVLRSRRPIVLRRIRSVLQRLLDYWHHRGYCMKVISKKEEALREKEEEAESRIKARMDTVQERVLAVESELMDRRRELDWQAGNLRTIVHVAEYLVARKSEYFHAGPLLATSSGCIFIIVHDTQDEASRTAAEGRSYAEFLRKLGRTFVEAVESYGPEVKHFVGNAPWRGGNRTFTGWELMGSKLTGVDPADNEQITEVHQGYLRTLGR